MAGCGFRRGEGHVSSRRRHQDHPQRSSPEALANGSTLFHEHLDGVYSRDTRQLKLPPPSSADITPVIADVKDAMKNGVVCIVDGGHPDMGVNYDHLKQISMATGLHVVASGGYYIQNTYPAEISTMSEDQIAESLVKEAAASEAIGSPCLVRYVCCFFPSLSTEGHRRSRKSRIDVRVTVNPSARSRARLSSRLPPNPPRRPAAATTRWAGMSGSRTCA